MSTLVTLALIPFALFGALIAFIVARWLLPYVLVVTGLMILWVGQAGSLSPGDAGGVSALGSSLAIIGGLWLWTRWAKKAPPGASKRT